MKGDFTLKSPQRPVIQRNQPQKHFHFSTSYWEESFTLRKETIINLIKQRHPLILCYLICSPFPSTCEERKVHRICEEIIFLMWVIYSKYGKENLDMKTMLPILKYLYDYHWQVARTPRRLVDVSLLPDGMILSFVHEGWGRGTGGESVFLWPGFGRMDGFFSTQLHGCLLLAWYGQLL